MKTSIDIVNAIELADIKDKYMHALRNLSLFSTGDISYESLAKDLKDNYPKYAKYLYKKTSNNEIFIGCFIQKADFIYNTTNAPIVSFVFLPTNEYDIYTKKLVMDGLIFMKENKLKNVKWIF